MLNHGRDWHGFGDSLSIAYRAMEADWEAGSQGDTPAACARHAMTCPGTTSIQAYRNNSNLINNALNDGDLGLAAHAIQDRYAGGHEGFQFWPGSFSELGLWETIKHIFLDTFPSPSSISNAYDKTKSALKGKHNKKDSEDSDDECYQETAPYGSENIDPWLPDHLRKN